MGRSGYPAEFRRKVLDLLAGPEVEVSITGACQRVGAQLRINVDTLRGWVKQAQIDAGAKPGLRSDERRRIVELKRENRELRRANAILKTGGCRTNRLTVLRCAAVSPVVELKYLGRGLQLHPGRSGAAAADASLCG